MLAVVWALVCVVATGWVAQEASGVSFGNALLVGGMLASVVTFAVRTLARGG